MESLEPASDAEDAVVADLIRQQTRENVAFRARERCRQCQWDFGVRAYMRRVLAVYGWRFVAFLFFSQFVLKGVVITLLGSLALPIYRNAFGVDATQLQIYSMIGMAPWSVKPLLGLLSDLTRCGGYHKRWWLVQSIVLGTLGGGISILTLTRRSAIGFTLCMAAGQTELALYDLLSEAHYSAVSRDTPESGSDVVTLVQVYQRSGSLLATFFVGPIGDSGLFVPALTVLTLLMFCPLFPTLMGWLPETHYPQDGVCRPRLVGTDQLYKDRWMILIIALTGLAAPLTSALANVGDPLVALSLALVLTTASLVGAWMAFPRMIARIATYRVLATLSRPTIGSAMDYWYTAGPECVPGGPNFSFAYYMTVAGIVGTFTALAGAFVYQRWMSDMRFRPVVVITNLLGSVIGASDLFLVLRINVALGIPDKTAYMVGEAVMEPLIGMLNYMADSALLNKAVPPGMEGSAYAFIAGLSNYAYMISELSGALIFEAAGVRTSLPCDFGALWWLVLVCHVGAPAVVGVPAAWALIPMTGQREAL